MGRKEKLATGLIAAAGLTIAALSGGEDSQSPDKNLQQHSAKAGNEASKKAALQNIQDIHHDAVINASDQDENKEDVDPFDQEAIKSILNDVFTDLKKNLPNLNENFFRFFSIEPGRHTVTAISEKWRQLAGFFGIELKLTDPGNMYLNVGYMYDPISGHPFIASIRANPRDGTVNVKFSKNEIVRTVEPHKVFQLFMDTLDFEKRQRLELDALSQTLPDGTDVDSAAEIIDQGQPVLDRYKSRRAELFKSYGKLQDDPQVGQSDEPNSQE